MAKQTIKVNPEKGKKGYQPGGDTFEYEGKKYVVLMSPVKIPVREIGVVTAADICASEDAQKWLVEQNTIGTVIKEVV